MCTTSQALNDWFDRHGDAINEPQRPIPSGCMRGRWELCVACGWAVLSLVVASLLGKWGFAAVVGLLLAYADSATPIRWKRNGWWGKSACGLCHEGLAWITDASVIARNELRPDRIGLCCVLHMPCTERILQDVEFASAPSIEYDC